MPVYMYVLSFHTASIYGDDAKDWVAGVFASLSEDAMWTAIHEFEAQYPNADVSTQAPSYEVVRHEVGRIGRGVRVYCGFFNSDIVPRLWVRRTLK